VKGETYKEQEYSPHVEKDSRGLISVVPDGAIIVEESPSRMRTGDRTVPFASCIGLYV
jgi:hypothetical protein